MFSRFFRHIKEGFFGVGRHAAMSISSASAVTITLIIISIFVIFTVNVNSMTNKIEGEVQISVMIGYDSEAQENIDRIGLSIQEIPGVEAVTFSSKEEELDYFIASFTDDHEKEIFESYREDNPMHHAYYVKVTDGSDLKPIATQIEAIEGVDTINYGGDSSVMLVNALDSVRTGGFVIVVALSLLAIFLIQNTIKVTILARANEIAIMRNVGAKNGFIRAPFVVEGMIIGALGAIIPIFATIFGYIFAYSKLNGILISSMFIMIPPHPFVLQISLLLLVVGMLVGLIGSFLSVTKYLRWKR
ncbi:permease-like cell division protein FtsX [Anaerorhabdus sp.]|uniref:permease-like cell division protein FtsX n=1 Tax=Anaerorhabdus sp. TaxID=1872524 RepID=UPI002FC6E2EA